MAGLQQASPLTLSTIAEANERAITDMQQGKNSAAVATLQAALTRLFTLRNETISSANAEIYPSFRGRQATIQEMKAERDIHLEGTVTDVRRVSIDQATRTEQFLPLAMYNWAFSFSATSACNVEQRSFQMAAIVMLFNLGLANHRWGLDTGRSSLLLVALCFYQDACLWVRQSNGVLSRQEEMTKIFMALMYNMSVLYGDFWETSKARTLRSQLFPLVIEIFTSGRSVAVEEFSFFFVNISLGDMEGFRLAPAA